MAEDGEIKEIREVAESYLKDLKNVDKITIIFARRMNGNWKVIVRYSTPEDPYTDIMSMVMINRTSKEVEYFRENIQTY